MGCQKKIAADIVDKGGDYVLSLKGNHEQIHDDVKTFFESEVNDNLSEFTIKTTNTVEKDHGRIEERNYFLCDQISCIPEFKDWTGLDAIGAVQSKRTINSVSTMETRYFLTTLTDVSEFSVFARKHWSI
jgi:predicted transposase YbfD/YdcC